MIVNFTYKRYLICLNFFVMIKDNLQTLFGKIDYFCSKYGRKTEEIKLVAVSKTQEIWSIKQAIEFGVTNFGENRPQEFRDKYEVLGDTVKWHFIGNLQSNKIKYVAGKAELIHSIGSLKSLKDLNDYCIKNEIKQSVLFEVKTSFEDSKKGFNNYEDLQIALEFALTTQNIEVQGLMTMAPFVDDEDIVRESFRNLRLLKEKLEKNGYPLKHLSMGMSDDFNFAIEEGSTIIRVGSAIFGERY